MRVYYRKFRYYLKEYASFNDDNNDNDDGDDAILEVVSAF